jgi:hypothetical protein
MGIFKWDKLVLELKTNTTDWCGIYHGSACAYFANFINTFITKSDTEQKAIIASMIKMAQYETKEQCEQNANEQLKEQNIMNEDVKELLQRTRSIEQQTIATKQLLEQQQIATKQFGRNGTVKLDSLKVVGLRDLCIELHLNTSGCRIRDDYISLLAPHIKQ